MGAAPWFGLGYEFKCEQTLATSSNAKASKSVFSAVSSSAPRGSSRSPPSGRA